MASQERKLQVRDAIAQFAAGNFRRSRMVVTCRTRSYRDKPWQLPTPSEAQPDGFAGPFELADFDNAKIKDFVERWYSERGRVDGFPADDAQRLAGSLWDALRDPSFSELLEVARSPLRLTVMALVHNRDQTLPRESAKLYARMVEVLLFRWENVRWRGHPTAQSLSRLLAGANLNESDFTQALGNLAWDVHERASRPNVSSTHPTGVPVVPAPPQAPEDRSMKVLKTDLEAALKRFHPGGDEVWRASVIRLVKERAGLLMEVDDDLFDFPHGSFREYLAGLHLANSESFPQSGDLVEPSRHWWEVVKWAAGWMMHVNPFLPARPSLRDLVDQLAGTEPFSEPTVWLRAILAGEIVVIMRAEALVRLQAGQACLDRVKLRLIDLIQSEVPPPSEREQAAIALGKLGDPRPGVGLKAGLPDIDWIALPPGGFKLRETGAPFEIQSFKLSRYPVTCEQYHAFVAYQGYADNRPLDQGGYWDEEGLAWRQRQPMPGPEIYEPVFQTPNHPQVGVSWYEAAAFCRWVCVKRGLPPNAIRLPHEAEWEWAARCVRTQDPKTGEELIIAHPFGYPWGNDDPKDLATRCNMGETGIGHTSGVGLFPGGRANCGAVDLSGNVWEWCENWYDDKTKESRVLRGGSWVDVHPGNLSVSCRNGLTPVSRGSNIGFRCVWVSASSL